MGNHDWKEIRSVHGPQELFVPAVRAFGFVGFCSDEIGNRNAMRVLGAGSQRVVGGRRRAFMRTHCQLIPRSPRPRDSGIVRFCQQRPQSGQRKRRGVSARKACRSGRRERVHEDVLLTEAWSPRRPKVSGSCASADSGLVEKGDFWLFERGVCSP